MKNKKKKMRLSKFTKLTLSALMVLTCVHFSSVKAEDSSVEGSSSPETVEIVETPKVEETPAPTTTPEIVETTPEPTPEVVESTPEPTPEVVEATPAPTVEPVAEETPAPAAETPAPVEASKEATEDKANTATKGYKLVEVTTLEEENSGEGTSVDENKEAAETFKVNYEVVVDDGEPLSDYEKVVTVEGIKSDVNAKEKVSFTVSPKDGYTVLSVKQNDTELTANENQYTTDLIEAETTIRIELQEKVAAEEPVDENQTVSADVSTTGEIMTDFYVKADRSTVTVGETVNVKAIIKPDSFSNKSVKWTSSNPEIATVDENGLVTTLAVGTVTITGKSVANEDMTDFDIITVNPIQVSKITITGYTKEYMLPNETVKLNATVEPDNAADKSLIWTSSDETIATVDQDGNVKALEQGEVTIRVANETSGKYAEQKIKVYNATPKTANVQVWVTNQYRGVSYQINLPADGTEVNASDVIQKVDGYVSTNIIRVVAGESGSSWSAIQDIAPVQKFKYENNEIKYTTDGSSWENVGNNKIVAFYAISTNNTKPELGTTDVRVALGDWPYAENEAKDHDRQTIQITIVDGSNNLIYDSGRLRYDNNSNGEYGKIEFNCDESRYEIKEILVYQSKDSGTGTLVKTYTSVPTGGISVSFKTGETNHYLIKSVVTPKEFDVTYDINGGKEGSGPASTKLTAVNGTKVTVATSPQPTKEGYIFAGWEYEGTTYYGGESFEMPAHSVTFKAKWLQSSGVITYSSNNEEWGTVSRSYETLKAGVTEVKGSAAKANEGYVFVGWKNNQDGQFVSNDSYYTPEAKPGSYTAVFKVKANIKDRLELIKADVITTYDGKAHAAGTATVTGDDVVGIKIEYQKADGSWTTNPSEITATNVSDSKTVNIRVTSEKYNGELTGTEELTITKREVTLTSETAEKPYDGTPLTRPTVKVEGDRFVDGEVRDLRATGTITNVGGPVTNTIEYTGVESKFNADNYEIKKHEGTLRITKAGKVGLTVEGAERKYNGEPLSATKVETSVTKGTTISYSIDDGSTWTAEAPSITNAGTLKVTVKAENPNYKTATSEYTLTITKREVTLTSETAEKPYDGTPLTRPTVKVEGDRFVDGEVRDLRATGTITNVGGPVTNTIEYTGVESKFNADNYEIKKHEGTLRITKAGKVGLTVEGAERKYNGEPLSATKVETSVTKGTTISYSIDDGSTWTAEAPSITNAGTLKVTVKAENPNYKTATSEYTLTITKREVTLTSETAEKPYDGTPLTRPTVKVEGDGFVDGEVRDLRATGTITYVGGPVTNTIEYTGVEGKFNADNYEIKKHEGTLRITKAGKVGLTVEGAERKYNGEPLSATKVETSVTKGTTISYSIDDGSTWTAEAPSITNAGTLKVTVKAENPNYKTATSEYTLTITKREVTLTSETAEKPYDGTPLTRPTVKVEGDGFVDGEVRDLRATGTITYVGGPVTNTIEYTGVEGKFNADNYEIKKHEGTLRITKAGKVGLTVEGAERKYNGEPLSATKVETSVTKGTTISYSIDDGSTWTAEAPSITDAGTLKVTVKAENPNYATATAKYTLKITKREVTLTSEKASKAYDGTALTKPEVTVSGDGFVEGEVRDLRATGTIVNVGSVANAIEYTGVEGKFNADNYEIKKHEGTLRITKAGKVGLTVEGAERKYNGEPLSATKVETSVTKGTTISYSIDDGSTWTAEAPSITNAGTLKVTVKAENPNYKTATSEYTLTITKREVTLTSEKASKAYDGTALTKPEVTVSGDGFVEGEVRDLRATGTIVNVGSVANAIEYTGVEGKFNADNYEIKKHEGTLTITPKEVTVTVENKTKQFGEADPELTATVTGVVDSYKIAYTVTRDAGENVGEYVITASGADVQGNYTVTYEVGKLTITSKSIIPGDETGITVTGLENVMYDGQNHKQEPTVTDTKTGKVLVSETDYILVYPADTTNAGTVTITVKGIGNYSGEPTVSYVITKRNVKLTSETAEKPYDGTALTRPTVKVDGDGFVEGEVTDLKATGTITNVGGPVDNPITFTTLENFKDGNYTIEQVVGNLTITAKSIEDEDSGLKVEKPANVTYNGKEQKQKPVVKDTKLNTTLVEDTDYTLTYSEDVKNAGKVTVTVTGKGNYEGTLETTYSIIARNVTLTSGSASKEYDGTPLTKAGVVISEDGFVEDEVADVLAVGSITNVGSVDNTIKIVATDKFNENNYVIKYELGKLTVTEKNDPKPEPTEEPKGCPVDTVWNEEKGICEKAVVVPVVPGGGNKPKVTPEPTIAPSETPEASATPTIEPTSTPKPTSSAETGIIDDDATPSTTRKAHWALINLIAAIGSVLFGLLLLLSKNEKDADKEDEDETDEEGTQKRNKVWKVVSLVDAIIAVVVFVLTENMKQPMVLVDKWTMLMILFTLISIVSFAFGRKYHEEDEKAENA